MKLLRIPSTHSFFSLDLHTWCKQNLIGKKMKIGEFDWSLLFGTAIDSLWNCRNHFIFYNKVIGPNQVCCEILGRCSWSAKAFRIFSPAMVCAELSNNSVIRWFPPDVGWCKLNTDGSFSAQRKIAACGGVVRDHNGNFLFAFSKHLGNCTVMQAELWGILYGLKLVQQRGFRKTSTETDSSSSVQLISSGCPQTHPYFSLVADIQSLILAMDQVLCTHIFREANSVADELAKFGLSLDNSSRSFDVVPSFCYVKLLLDSDIQSFEAVSSLYCI
ncbi:unnamed protein product [Lupinus luteus]|uniref:RNase H type-1 domain-containing protein n=1 Tax=Lupinus luteus TaxID=3873 RepID=A0AAV1Y2J3_LUPLU